MQNVYQEALKWIDEQQSIMSSLLENWANINSWSENLEGLSSLMLLIEKEFSSLNALSNKISLAPRKIIDSHGNRIEKPLGQALHLKKHSELSLQIFLGGHMDTVFPPTSPFQTCKRIDKDTLLGPGTADMKGGLIILLKTLQALERSPWAGKIGWEVLINPDEEIGSPGSNAILSACAKRNHFGLLFEPSFADGSLVSSRKGSANFTVVAKGKAAHAGRDFQRGRNAITALSRFIVKAEKLTQMDKGITLNVGHIEGGGPVNIVPELAICRINVRIEQNEDLNAIKAQFNRWIHEDHNEEGISLNIFEDTNNPPKPFDGKIQALYAALKECADQLNIPLHSKPSGGACDGCRLYAEGLPNIDTLGAVGGNIHTTEEYIHLPSLAERAKLTALFLIRLAAGDLEPTLGIKV